MVQEFVFFDYFTYTLRLTYKEEIFELLGIPEKEFEHLNKGPHHYDETYNLDNIITLRVALMNNKSLKKYGIHSDDDDYEIYLEYGLEGERILKRERKKFYEISVNTTGRGIREFGKLSKYPTYFEMLRNMVDSEKNLAKVVFTRVDFTKDDKEGLLDLDVIEKKIKNNRVVTHLGTSFIKSMQDPEDKGVFHGKTIYFGSKDSNSEFFIRMYNKSAENFAKGKVLEKDLVEHNTRVEMVFKKPQSDKLMDKVFEYDKSGKNLGDLYGEILLGKLKILKNGKVPSKKFLENMKNLDDRYRKFIHVVKQQHLGVEKESSSIEKKKEYIFSLKKTIAMLEMAMGKEDFEIWMNSLILEGRNKMSGLEKIEAAEFFEKNHKKDEFKGKEKDFDAANIKVLEQKS